MRNIHAGGPPIARPLPPLNALRAFEAAARHLSFTRAAAELNVTQGAVSHQVKALEAELGAALFRRLHQRLELTRAGADYLPTVREAFDRLRAGTAALRERDGSGVLTVSVSPNFAAKWLVHRLDRFAAAHPGIDLRIGATVEHVDFARDGVDLAIRHGDGRWPDLHVVRVAAESIVPVCSPALTRGRRALRRPADLRHHVLLRDANRDHWPAWLEAAGVTGLDLARGPRFDQSSINWAIDAAVAGQGVALARTMLCAADLLAGRLLRPFGTSLPAPYAYWAVCPKPAAERAKVARFRDWLVAEAAADQARLAALEAGE